MPIDLSAADLRLLSPTQAGRLPCMRHPVSRNPRHASAVRRYMLHGIKVPGFEPIKLEHVRIAGQLFTTQECVEVWIERQTHPDTPIVRSDAQRRHESERASRELAAAGW